MNRGSLICALALSAAVTIPLDGTCNRAAVEAGCSRHGAGRRAQ